MKLTLKHNGRLMNLGARLLAAPLSATMLEGSEPQRVAAVIRRLRPQYPPEDLVRIGSAGDGGYLMPRDIDGYSLLISPGVGFSYDFDRHFFSRGVQSVLIDASVDVPAEPHMVHLKKFVGGYSSEAENLVSLADLVEE